ncbi:CatB-related O-acetyltransferase, partial [Yersinia sp. 2544 StPb PI]|uniref:CatB-related O-acetyltransferase n=2 Tax=Yersinia TaxID=629 RepID=UPI003B2828A0
VKEAYFEEKMSIKPNKSVSTIAKSAIVPHIDSEQFEHPVHIGPNCAVRSEKIGRYTFINANTIIFDMVEIGRFCTFARGCHIAAVEHPFHFLSSSFYRISNNWFPDDPIHKAAAKIRNRPAPDRKRAIKTVIGNDVWFGANSLILKGINIGDGAVIGAGAVVTKDVPPYAIVAGNPAKIIKMRFDSETISKLICIKWWDLELSIIEVLPMDDIQKCIKIIEELK